MNHPIGMGKARRQVACQLVFSSVVLLAWTSSSHAQSDYLLQTGSPTFTVAEPVELGYVNVSNGNLHLEVPLTSASQRGRLGFTAKLVYDSRIWQVVNNGSSKVWQPTNVPNSMGGWRFVTTADGSPVTYSATVTTCGSHNYTVYSGFYWTAADGTRRFFPATTQQDNGCGVGNISTATADAQDSSGYYISVSNYTQAVVYARDGTVVSDSTQSAYRVKDPQGNFFTADANGNVIDTLNRAQVTTTVNGSTITYNVLNSQGSTSTFTATTTSVTVNTAFYLQGVTDYSGPLTTVRTIGLLEGPNYCFYYNPPAGQPNYGVVSGINLPTAGGGCPTSPQISYTYTKFPVDAATTNLWVSQRTSTLYEGAFSYTPAQCSTGCSQQVTVTRPSSSYSSVGDDTVYKFTLNNGAWNTETDSWTGSSTNGRGTLLRTVTTDYDFSQPCPTQGCTGNAYIRPIRNSTTYPVPSGNISRKTEYSYDNPQYGNVNEVREWKYYTGTPSGTADRVTDTTYLTTSSYVSKNMISLPTDVTVKRRLRQQDFRDRHHI